MHRSRPGVHGPLTSTPGREARRLTPSDPNCPENALPARPAGRDRPFPIRHTMPRGVRAPLPRATPKIDPPVKSLAGYERGRNNRWGHRRRETDERMRAAPTFDGRLRPSRSTTRLETESYHPVNMQKIPRPDHRVRQINQSLGFGRACGHFIARRISCSPTITHVAVDSRLRLLLLHQKSEPSPDRVISFRSLPPCHTLGNSCEVPSARVWGFGQRAGIRRLTTSQRPSPFNPLLEGEGVISPVPADLSARRRVGGIGTRNSLLVSDLK